MDDLLDTQSIKILNDLLERTIENPTGIDSKRFRMDYVDDRKRIQALINGNLLKADDKTNQIRVHAMGLLFTTSDTALALIADINRILEIIREAYRSNLDTPVLVADIGKRLKLPIKRIAECLTYINDIQSIAGTTDLTDKKACIYPSEGFIDFETIHDRSKLFLPAFFPEHFKQKSASTKQHGNVEVNASKREQVLAAAIYVMANYHDQCTTGGKYKAAQIAALIENKAPLWWHEDGEPPLSNRKMRELINKCLSVK